MGDQKKKKNTLPSHLQEKKRLVILKNEAPTNTIILYYSGAHREMGVDNSFSMDHFKANFKIHLITCDDESLVFDMVGVDAPIANALRRILISEVPTVAIEKVFIYNNTSIMQDEVLAHRLGLVPIKVDPRRFVYKNKLVADYTSSETVVFRLEKKCTRNPDPNAEEKYLNSAVHSRDLIWVPQAEQAEEFAEDPARPVHEDILLVKLRPGQEVVLEAYCEKGVGKDHAKFSPVATATYRLLPEISFKEDITGNDADELVNLCPMKVFDIEDLGKAGKRAIVARPRNCTMCRECIRPAKFTDKIQLGRVKDHFIFSVESTGVLPPRVLFQEAVKELIAKCETVERYRSLTERHCIERVAFLPKRHTIERTISFAERHTVERTFSFAERHTIERISSLSKSHTIERTISFAECHTVERICFLPKCHTVERARSLAAFTV